MSSRLTRIIASHERWRGEQCLNLIASENITSPKVRKILGSDLGHRYTAPDHFYMGSRFTDEVEETARKLCCEVFGSEWADVTPLSGHVADMALLSTFAHPGDKILSVGPDGGGYPGILGGGYARILGLRNIHFPFDRQRWNIEADKATDLIVRERPRLVILGASFIPFPHPTQQISKACLEAGSTLAFDGSHVLGLIGGGAFQQPLKEGARILVGSTHKSFFGPQGGIIASFRPEGERIKETMFPAIVDNAHWNRIAALAQALLEMKRFGNQYSRQVIRNSQALAEALDDADIPVRCKEYGYTASHQVLLDMDRLRDADEVPHRLQEANIIVDRGIRLGTTEVTRRGMREKEMTTIASLIGEVVSGRESPNGVRKRVIKLARRFGHIFYA